VILLPVHQTSHRRVFHDSDHAECDEWVLPKWAWSGSREQFLHCGLRKFRHSKFTHCLRLNLQLHTIDLVRTCRISSFCTVAWQLARLQLTRRIARSLGDSWASCTFLVPAYRVVPDKGPLNGCVCVVACNNLAILALFLNTGICCSLFFFG